MSFSEFWAIYPKRKGANPRMPAEKKFDAAVKNGTDPKHIIASATRYRDESRQQNLENTPYVCMAVTWLNQQRWLDYAPSDYEEKKFAETQAKMLKIGWRWTGERWIKLADEKHNPPEGIGLSG